MRPWVVLLCGACIIFLISLIRFGLIVRYNESGLWVMVRFGILKWTLLPLKKKKKQKKHRPKEPEKPSPEQEMRKNGSLEQLQRYLPLISEAAGRFKSKLRVDECDLELIWAADDPADAAMGFGYANAVIGMLWPLIEHNFTIRRRDIRTSVNFDAEKPTIKLHTAVSLRIGQGVIFGAIMGIKLLSVMRKNKKDEKLKEAV